MMTQWALNFVTIDVVTVTIRSQYHIASGDAYIKCSISFKKYADHAIYKPRHMVVPATVLFSIP